MYIALGPVVGFLLHGKLHDTSNQGSPVRVYNNKEQQSNDGIHRSRLLVVNRTRQRNSRIKVPTRCFTKLIPNLETA
jgi:hypothetical protein